MSTLAVDLVHRQVAVIVGSITAMRMARDVSSTIPIVFVSGGDPIALNVVTNLSRPGGNITGVSFASAPLQPKRLGLLHELIPPSATIAWLRDPRGPGFEEEGKEVPPAARELGRELLALNAQSTAEIDAACDHCSITRQRTAYRCRHFVQHPAPAAGGAHGASWSSCDRWHSRLCWPAV